MAYKTSPLQIPIEVDGKQATISISELKTQLNSIQNKSDSFSSSLKNSMVSQFAFGNLAAQGFSMLVSKIQEGISAVFKYSESIAMAKMSFTALLGSAELATNQIVKLTELSKDSPLPFDELLKSTRILLAYGIEVEQTNSMLKKLGDIAAVTGGDLQGLALVYGQIQSAGRLLGQDALQLSTRGIPIYKELAEILGLSILEVKKLGEQGLITAEQVDEVFQKMTDSGGRFFNGQQILMNTYSGQWEVFTENLKNTFSGLANHFLEKAKFTLLAVNSLFKEDSENEKIQKLGKLGYTLETLKEQLKDEKSFLRQKMLEGSINGIERDIRELKKSLGYNDKYTPKVPQTEIDFPTNSDDDVVDDVPVDDVYLKIAESYTTMTNDMMQANIALNSSIKGTAAGAKEAWRDSIESTIAMGDLLMSAADGQSRTLFEVGKTLSFGNAVMKGVEAVQVTYANNGGWPWGIIPAGIMAGIAALNVNRIWNTKYGSGNTAGTAIKTASTGSSNFNLGKAVNKTEEERAHLAGFLEIDRNLLFLKDISKNTKLTADRVG